MTNKIKPVRLWVHPDYKRKIKIEAAEQGKKIIELTEELAHDCNKIKKTERKKEVKFGFPNL